MSRLQGSAALTRIDTPDPRAGEVDGASKAIERSGKPVAFLIDLDRFVPADFSLELTIAAVKNSPLRIPQLCARALVQDRAAREASLCADPSFDPSCLDIEPAVWDAARLAHQEGRPVALVTAHHHALAAAIARRDPIFEDVVAIAPAHDGLDGLAKAAAIARRYPQGSEIAGQTQTGAAAWTTAEPAKGPPAKAPASPLRIWAKACRLHQWAKNLLVFVPVILGGAAGNPQAWLHVVIGFLALGFVASSTYLLNDILDLSADRRHRTKRNRPIASGALPLERALLATPLGLAIGLGLAAIAGGAAGVSVAVLYLLVTVAYSFELKRLPIIDAATLAMLFTLRLLAGAAISGIPLSPWLMVFSMFLFTSLAFAKRSVEVLALAGTGRNRAAGRGYVAADGPVLLGLGIASGTGSIFIFVMYLVEEAFQRSIYQHPEWLWAAPVLLFLWLGRIWLLCGRGELDEDPVVFAIKDRASLGLGALMGLSVILAWI